ncbi:MAG: dockerin type I repeat-containing protein [Gemmatimonadota bacterium]|nr:MAG: dockerin type I repeat-containing protein [Gemmatimonadota bacterium]
MQFCCFSFYRSLLKGIQYPTRDNSPCDINHTRHKKHKGRSPDSTYTFDIIITSNDLAHPIIRLPATVTVKRSIGDVSQDGSIDIVDLIFVEYFILGIGFEPTQYQLWAADINGDCDIDILDVIEIGHQMLPDR